MKGAISSPAPADESTAPSNVTPIADLEPETALNEGCSRSRKRDYWKSDPSNPSSAPASFTDEAESEEAATLLLILETSFHAKGKIYQILRFVCHG
ncbi:hypothetical protein MRB53_036321 [Persea americana]|nr:hypothetical protein MRB53_042411 [Persea americana]KAJ8609163.1 hypothetical protein MRB53_039278 [Persea americana]KAJ8614754.1 hypothetical protein MRB53_036420 [Persea americana]KAJ8614908.1 hypothetical protein MRB53_036321 [Persea americana]